MHLLTFSGTREKDFYDMFATYGAGSYVAFAFGYESGCITTDVTAESYEYEVADPMVGEPFSNLTGDVSVTCTEAYFEPAFDDTPSPIRLSPTSSPCGPRTPTD